MKVVVHNYYNILNTNNNMFKGVGDFSINFFLEQMKHLYNIGKSLNVNLGSSSIFDLNECDAIIFIDFPKNNDQFFKKAIKSNKPLFLIVWESGIINSYNLNSKFLKFPSVSSFYGSPDKNSPS